MTVLPTPPFDIALIGAGRVGTAVSVLLKQRGHRIVAVSSRTEASAAAAADLLSAEAVPPERLPAADVVLVGVPDHALSATAELVARTGSQVAVHFAGSVGVDPLRAACEAVCALHPVQACPDVDTAVRRLPGSAWGVTCDEEVRAWAHRLIETDLEGTAVDVDEDDRARWHSAAVTTSNGIAALMATGEALLASMGIPSPEHVLGPIAAGTVANVRELGGGAKALTGPVVRNEAAVIARHLDAISAQAPELLAAYRSAVCMIVDAATATGRIDKDDALEMTRLLGRP